MSLLALAGFDARADAGVFDAAHNQPCHAATPSLQLGDEEARFEFDEKGRLTKKITASTIKEFTYEPVLGKVNRVATQSTNDKSKAEWTVFTYDVKGELSAVKDSHGKEVTLEYDERGLLSTMRDENDRALHFKYGDNRRPTEITVDRPVLTMAEKTTDGAGSARQEHGEEPGPAHGVERIKIGSLSVSYDSAGEIEKVDNEGGVRTVLEIMSVQQQLLGLIAVTHVVCPAQKKTENAFFD